jgi:hypothetical protein
MVEGRYIDRRAGFHYVLAMLFVSAGAWMLSYALFDDSPHSPFSGSVHAQAFARRLESLLGVRGTEALLSILLLAMATLLGNYSFRGKAKETRIVALAVLAAIGLTIFGTGLLSAIPRWREEAWRRDVSGKICHLADGVAKSASSARPAIRKKIVVWDCTTRGLSLVQSLLPEERQGNSADPQSTFVLILATNDKEEQRKPLPFVSVPQYDDGTPACRRTLTVAAVNWPEQQLLGVWAVEGDSPGPLCMAVRAADEKGPVIGNTDEPLKRWILETVPTGPQPQAEK